VLPDFLVIGAQKAGSTYLVNALREHPQVHMPADEVPCFEDPDYESGAVDRLNAALARPAGVQRLGIKRAALLTRPECPPRIAEHCPQADLIALLRNPIERAVSSLFNLMHATKVPIMDVNRAMAELLDGSMQAKAPAAGIVLEFGRYAQALERYLQHFDRRKILLLLFDDLKRDPNAVVRTMYQFLGVNESHEHRPVRRRPMASVYSPTRLRILQTLQPLYTRLDERGLRRYPRRGPATPALRSLTAAVDRLLLAPMFRAEPPTLAPEIRRRLIDYYQDDVFALAELMKRDLSHWLAVDTN
jgi:hypothetical protein